ncbi:hypothetical protein BD309DRAFT_955299 [Dichomitus squalens]|uniref:Uncharacterized protein n=1 Tax=Dichomitus squalens TaxID=114155 RepID=A0A4Q9NXK2_9APHY|nr:hypothetical protein BD309DRAFT_955299 [Dichomitus squalens]TBU56556.1 hypothetical protein BD310DRAFT_931175 [Dichomitus squalens]
MLLCRATLSRALRSCPGQFRVQSATRLAGSIATSSPAKEFRVVLDNGTLYIDQELAQSLGWHTEVNAAEGVPLTLHGWGPHYFAISRTGSDSEALARRTAASGNDLKVLKVLEYLKDR